MKKKVADCLRSCLQNTKCYLTKDRLETCFQGIVGFPDVLVEEESQFLPLNTDHDSLSDFFFFFFYYLFGGEKLLDHIYSGLP